MKLALSFQKVLLSVGRVLLMRLKKGVATFVALMFFLSPLSAFGAPANTCFNNQFDKHKSAFNKVSHIPGIAPLSSTSDMNHKCVHDNGLCFCSLNTCKEHKKGSSYQQECYRYFKLQEKAASYNFHILPVPLPIIISGEEFSLFSINSEAALSGRSEVPEKPPSL